MILRTDTRLASVARWWPANLSLSTGIVVLVILGFAPLFGWMLASAITVDRFLTWLMFILICGVAFVPLIVRWPVVTTFGLYALVATSLDAFPLVPGGASLTKPIGLMAGAALLGAGLVERRLGRPPGAALWWALFMLWSTLSVVWAIDDTLAFKRLPTALSLFFLYVVAVSFRPSRRELHWVCASSVLGGVFAAALAYLFGLNQLAGGHAARGRLVLGDMDTNPNTLGAVLLMPLGFAIAGLIASRGRLQRVVIVGCIALISMGIFISMSRTAVVAMVAMVSVFVYRLKARKQIVAAMVLLVAVSAAAPQKFYDRMEAMITRTDETGSGRTEIWKIGIDALPEFGLVGAGLSNYTEVHKRYAYTDKGSGAHNMYLMTAIDLGIPGMVLLLAALGSGFLAVQRARSAGHRSITLVACEAVGVGMLIGGLFADRLWSKSFWLLWILLTWAISSEGRPDEDGESTASATRG
jgi:O-antigen ligase